MRKVTQAHHGWHAQNIRRFQSLSSGLSMTRQRYFFKSGRLADTQRPITTVGYRVLKCAAASLIDGAGLKNEMKRFWELDSLGIKPEETSV